MVITLINCLLLLLDGKLKLFCADELNIYFCVIFGEYIFVYL